MKHPSRNPVNSLHRAASTVLILGVLFGLTMVVVTPPFQAPDAIAHFFRAYQTSEFDLELQKRDHRVGAELPRSLYDTAYLFEDVKLDPSRKVHAAMYLRALSMRDDFPTFCSPIAPYPPVPYAAQAAGILLGRVVHAPPIVFLYFGRIMNLALFLFLTVWAVQLIPFMRWGLALLILMPMTIFLASTLSPDAFTIGISFLFISFILKCAVSESALTTREILIIFAGAAILALTKQGYSPIVFLSMLIPSDRFGSRRRKALAIAGFVLLTGVISAAYSISTRDYLVEGLPGSSTAGQLGFIITHPFSYLAIMVRSFFRIFYIESFIGRLGWLDVRLPSWTLVLYGLALFFVPFTRPDKREFVRWQRFIIGGILLLLVCLVFTMLYLTWTPVGRVTVAGVQGRYLIPFAPLLLLLFKSRRFSFPLGGYPVARRILVGLIVVVHLVSVAALIARYYPI